MCSESMCRRCRPFSRPSPSRATTSRTPTRRATTWNPSSSTRRRRRPPAAFRSARAWWSRGYPEPTIKPGRANQLNTSQSSLGQLNALQNYTSQIDNLFGTTAAGLTTALQTYYSGWSAVAQRSDLHRRAAGAARRCAERSPPNIQHDQHAAQQSELGREYPHLAPMCSRSTRSAPRSRQLNQQIVTEPRRRRPAAE